MILPNVRASFGRAEANFALGLLIRGDEDPSRSRAEDRLREEGLDAILDDPRTLNGLMASGGISAAPAPLVFYLVVRHALLEGGIRDRIIADYVAALLLRFGRQDQLSPLDGEERPPEYLIDIVEAMESARGREAFLLRAHLGNFALWLSGLFPDRIAARVHRRGAPGLDYYESLGATGYRMAATCNEAHSFGLNVVYRSCAESFPELRVALNRIADRYLFASRRHSIDRMLRRVSDGFRFRSREN